METLFILCYLYFKRCVDSDNSRVYDVRQAKHVYDSIKVVGIKKIVGLEKKNKV